MKLIINAEDFGFSQSINKGIEFCLKNKLITNASIMISAPYAEQAIDLCKKNGFKNIGVHLNLTWGYPVSNPKQIRTLCEKSGKFHYMCSMPFFGKYEDAKKELKAQIEKFKKSGLKPAYLDFHHFFCEMPEIFRAYLELAKEYNLPCRTTNQRARAFALEAGVKTPDIFCNSFHDYSATEETIKQLCNTYQAKDVTIELMTTPGYIDDYTTQNTTYLKREIEIYELKKAKENDVYKNIELISFADL